MIKISRTRSAKRKRDNNDDAQGGQRPANRFVDIDYNNTVTVLVGDKEQPFILHQEAVCARSTFFKAACSNKWREGQEKLVRLPEVTPIAFKSYCVWIYSGETPESVCTPESSVQDIHDEQSHLIDLYVLGDTLDDLALRNRVVLTLAKTMRKQKQILDTSQCRQVYKSTLPGCQIRKMIVEAVVSLLDRENLDENIASYPQELILEIAKAAAKLAPGESWDKVEERVKQNQETEKAE